MHSCPSSLLERSPVSPVDLSNIRMRLPSAYCAFRSQLNICRMHCSGRSLHTCLVCSNLVEQFNNQCTNSSRSLSDLRFAPGAFTYIPLLPKVLLIYIHIYFWPNGPCGLYVLPAWAFNVRFATPHICLKSHLMEWHVREVSEYK